MRAIFIAVGSELLEQNKIDTNSIYIAQKLMDKGILMDMKIVVGDDLTNLSWIVKNAYKRTQLVIITGGLGPTEDDITREAVSDALKKELEFKEEIVTEIEKRFKLRGMVMPQINTRQAFVIKDALVLPNEFGTAPGLYIDDEECKVLLLPGPPQEMKPIFDKILGEKIAPLSNYHVYRRCLKFAGVTESETDAQLAELYTKYKRNVKTTILANHGIIEIHLLGRSRKTPDEAQNQTDELAEKLKERMSSQLMTEKDITMEQFIVDLLKTHNLTLSTAESCTGGGLGHTITNVPGSSDVFLGGVVAYSNPLKMTLLDVKESTLEKHGAVSKYTAAEMAKGVRKLTGSDIGIGITGIAGPGGGARGKPVGLVFMHLSSAQKEIGIYKIFPGSREMVKSRAINFSLNLVREYLTEMQTG